jgi:hypothetical protein
VEAAPQEEEDEAGCRVHFYRDNESIFSDIREAHIFPVFQTQRRLLPWEEQLEPRRYCGSEAHAYSTHGAMVDQQLSDVQSWRYVRDHVRRRKPPRERQRAAVPGSTLEKGRLEVAEAQRARVTAEAPRRSILRGGTETSFYLPPVASRGFTLAKR